MINHPYQPRTSGSAITSSVLRSAKSSLETIKEIKRKRHEEKLADYLNVGRALSDARKLFRSTRLYGEYIKVELPDVQIFHPSLCTHCKWLYEALNVPGSEGADILDVLGVASLEEYRSANPTVIQRDYWKRQKANGITRSKPKKNKQVIANVDSQPVSDANLLGEAAAVTSATRTKKPLPRLASTLAR